MKLKGKSITPPKPATIVIPRGENEDVVFIAGPILDFEEFDRLVPIPKAPLVRKPGQKPYHDMNHPAYGQKLDRYAELKTAYVVLASLRSTDGLEWDTVDMANPETWSNYRTELAQHFTFREVDLIVEGVFQVNMPSEESRREALERFMSRQEEDNHSTSQTDEQDSTPSLESANALG